MHEPDGAPAAGLKPPLQGAAPCGTPGARQGELPAVSPAGLQAELHALRAELAAAREQARRYREIFERSASGQAIVSPDGRFLEVNQRLAEITGYGAGQLTGLGYQDITDPPDAFCDEEMVRLMEQRPHERVQVQRRYLRADGRTVWVQLTACRVDDAAGRLQYYIAVVDDITERRATEERLRQREAIFDRVSRYAPQLICTLRVAPDGTRSMPYASEAVRALYGFSPEEVALDSNRMAERAHPEDRQRLVHSIYESARTLQPLHLEYRLLHPERGLLWLRVDAGAVRDDDGGTTLYGVINDVTRHKQVEAQLKERDALLAALGRNVPGMTFKFTMTHDGRMGLPYVSDGVRDVYELEPDELQRDPRLLFERIHPDDLPELNRRMVSSASGATQEGTHTYRALLPRAGLRWLTSRAVAERDADGVTWYGHVSDITDHVLYEEAKVAAEAAERASQAKNEFLSRMSHELRTPLNAVLGFAQLLRMDGEHPLVPAQRAKVELIERAGAHLLGMIGDVLDLSRIEAGSLPLSLEPIALADTVGEAMELVRDAAQRAGVALLPPQLPPGLHVRADRLRLRQVMVNLLSNAIKYNRPRGTVAVGARIGADAVELEVRDTGAGLTAAQRSHLFEPFNRLGAERSGVEGTGIGLVIVHRLLDLMGAGIEVDSEPGRGSCFRLRLPAARPPQAPPQLVPVPHAGAAGLAPRGLRVLYAEDNAVNVELLRQVLALRPACTLAVARSGAEAIAAARAERPDLLLLDMHLGDMSGFDVTTALDADAATQGIPRVALSADAMPDRAHAARGRGFLAYLTKPLDVVQLLAVLDAQLDEQRDERR
ncbi:MAG: PAS domain S-box protein [Pseudomonadota bacterium]